MNSIKESKEHEGIMSEFYQITDRNMGTLCMNFIQTIARRKLHKVGLLGIS